MCVLWYIHTYMTHFAAASEVLADCPSSKDEGANPCSLHGRGGRDEMVPNA